MPEPSPSQHRVIAWPENCQGEGGRGSGTRARLCSRRWLAAFPVQAVALGTSPRVARDHLLLTAIMVGNTLAHKTRAVRMVEALCGAGGRFRVRIEWGNAGHSAAAFLGDPPHVAIGVACRDLPPACSVSSSHRRPRVLGPHSPVSPWLLARMQRRRPCPHQSDLRRCSLVDGVPQPTLVHDGRETQEQRRIDPEEVANHDEAQEGAIRLIRRGTGLCHDGPPLGGALGEQTARSAAATVRAEQDTRVMREGTRGGRVSSVGIRRNISESCENGAHRPARPPLPVREGEPRRISQGVQRSSRFVMPRQRTCAQSHTVPILPTMRTPATKHDEQHQAPRNQQEKRSHSAIFPLPTPYSLGPAPRARHQRGHRLLLVSLDLRLTTPTEALPTRCGPARQARPTAPASPGTTQQPSGD